MCMMMSNDPGQCVFCPRSFCTYLHMLWSGGGGGLLMMRTVSLRAETTTRRDHTFLDISGRLILIFLYCHKK